MTFPVALTRPLTWVDLETTGKNAKTARIVQIAITQFHPDGRVIEYWTLVNPGITIPPELTAIHGISNDDVIGKPYFYQIAAKLVRAFQGTDYAGYGIRFDAEVLRAEFARADVDTSMPPGVEPPRFLDGLRIWQIKQPRTLSAAVEEFAGHTHDAAHGAPADVAGAIEAVTGMFARWPDLPRDMAALHALQFPRPEGAVDTLGKLVWLNGEACINFGKHAYCEKEVCRRMCRRSSARRCRDLFPLRRHRVLPHPRRRLSLAIPRPPEDERRRRAIVVIAVRDVDDRSSVYVSHRHVCACRAWTCDRGPDVGTAQRKYRE